MGANRYRIGVRSPRRVVEPLLCDGAATKRSGSSCCFRAAWRSRRPPSLYAPLAAGARRRAARHRGQPNHRAANHDFTVNPPCADHVFTVETPCSHREFAVFLW
jgi:hypothetical protein